VHNGILDDILHNARENYIPVMLDATRQQLTAVVSELQPRRILEIGTAVGYSGIIMLTAAPDAHLYTIEMDEATAARAKANFAAAGVADRVTFFLGDAREIVLQLTGSYDFVFLDGPKGQYHVFLPYLLELLNTCGILFADNILYKGLVENVATAPRKHITIARNLNTFIEQISSDERLDTRILHIGDGISISRKIK
jgi:predicted O-methyltransferase YrrM